MDALRGVVEGTLQVVVCELLSDLLFPGKLGRIRVFEGLCDAFFLLLLILSVLVFLKSRFRSHFLCKVPRPIEHLPAFLKYTSEGILGVHVPSLSLSLLSLTFANLLCEKELHRNIRYFCGWLELNLVFNIVIGQTRCCIQSVDFRGASLTHIFLIILSILDEVDLNSFSILDERHRKVSVHTSKRLIQLRFVEIRFNIICLHKLDLLGCEL